MTLHYNTGISYFTCIFLLQGRGEPMTDDAHLIEERLHNKLQCVYNSTPEKLSLESCRTAFEETIPFDSRTYQVTVEPFQLGTLAAEWIIPADAIAVRVLLYFHSGIYINGSLETDRTAISMLANACRTKVLQIAYRLAPECMFPAPVEDGLTAYTWLLQQGYTAEQIALVGAAAGGGILLATLLRARDQGLPLPVVAACISPWVDLTLANPPSQGQSDGILSRVLLEYAAKLYAHPEDAATPLASPLYADLHGLPPIIVVVGEHEFLLDDAFRLRDRIRAAGGRAQCVPWGNMFHGWTAFADMVPEGRLALEQIAAYVEKYFALVAGTWPDETETYRRV
jgi:phosphinothricin tripeptide acetyl hydrolase